MFLLFSEIHEVYLDNYVSSVFGDIVRILRNPGPALYGLIKARLLGIRSAKGDVVVVLDAHMEVQEKWLEPILYEISKDKKILASITLDWMKPHSDGKYCFVQGV